MPVVEAHILEGHSARGQSRLEDALTQEVCRGIYAPDEAVTATMHADPPVASACGDQHRARPPAPPGGARSYKIPFIDHVGPRDRKCAPQGVWTDLAGVQRQ